MCEVRRFWPPWIASALAATCKLLPGVATVRSRVGTLATMKRITYGGFTAIVDL